MYWLVVSIMYDIVRISFIDIKAEDVYRIKFLLQIFKLMRYLGEMGLKDGLML